MRIAVEKLIDWPAYCPVFPALQIELRFICSFPPLVSSFPLSLRFSPSLCVCMYVNVLYTRVSSPSLAHNIVSSGVSRQRDATCTETTRLQRLLIRPRLTLRFKTVASLHFYVGPRLKNFISTAPRLIRIPPRFGLFSFQLTIKVIGYAWKY